MIAILRPSRTLLAISAALLLVQGAQGQTSHNWTNAAGGNWSVGTNWSTPPTFAAGAPETLNFGSFNTGVAANYTATNEIVGGAFTNIINFNNMAGPVITVANTTALTFNAAGGTNPSLNQNGFGLASIGAFTLGAASPFTYGGAGVGNVAFTGIITGNDNVQTFNQTGGGFLGTGANLIFTGVNVPGASGSYVLNNGNIVLNNSAALGASPVTVNGGTFKFGTVAAGTFANNFILNNTLRITNGGAFVANTFTGVISDGTSGPQGITFDNTTNFQGSFQNDNTFTGPVVMRPSATFAVNLFLASNAGQTLNGRLSGTTSITIAPFSTLGIDNTNATTTAVARLNPGATVTLNRANFTMTGNATLAGNEAFNTLVFNGHSILNLNAGAAQTGAGSNLTIQTWTLNNFATGFINASNLGNAPGANTGSFRVVNDPGGAIGGILPYAAANNSTTAVATNTFVRYDASGRIAGLNLGTDYQGGALPLYLNPSATAQYRQVVTQAALGNTTVNSLLLDTSGAAAQFVMNGITGPGTLNVTSGAILSSTFGGATAGTVPNTIGVDTLAFGGNTGYFHTPSGMVVTSTITGTNGISRGGGGALTLIGDNTFTGGVHIQFGNVVIDRDSNLGAASNTINLQSAQTGLFVLPNALYTTGSSNTLNTARNIVVRNGGGVVTVANSTAAMTATGTISGDGAFVKAGTGTLFLDPAAPGGNTHTGRTSLLAGILAVRNDAAMGSGGAPIEFLTASTGILQPLQSFTSPRNVMLAGTGTFFTNGSNLQIDGTIGTQSILTTVANLTKLGTGDLVLTGANTYNAATTVGTALGAAGGGVLVSVGATGTQTGGRLVLQGANGSAALSAAFTVNPGSTLVLDNTAAVNNFRVGMVGQTYNGSELSITGNATNGANTTQAIGAYTSNNLFNTVTLNQPASGALANVTTLQALSYTVANNATTFFRGTNLGTGTGDQSFVNFNTAPALDASGIIASAVGATSANGAPTDHVTMSGNTVRMFSGYIANNTNIGAAGVTDITAANVLGAASTAGAARMSTGGSVDLAGNSWTISSGNLLTVGASGNTITNTGAPANLALGANGRITNPSDLTLGTGVTISGTAVTKAGNGTLILNQGGTTTATWNVAQGTLQYGNGIANALPTTAVVTLGAGAALDLNNNTGVTLGAIAGFGTVNVGTNGLTVNPAAATVFMGSLQGSGPITKDGTLAMTVSGNSSGFSGAWNINAGTVTVNSNAALGTGTINLGASAGTATATLNNPAGGAVTQISNPIVVTPGGTGTRTISYAAGTSGVVSGNVSHTGTALFRITGPFSATAIQAGAWTMSGNITGTGPMDTFGGNWNLTGDNSGWSGTFAMNAGNANILGVGSNTALGTGTVTWLSGTTAGGMIRADGGARTLNNPIVINMTAVAQNSMSVTGMNDLTFTGPVLLNSAAVNHNVNIVSKGTTTFSGVISDAGGARPMSKTGFGDLVLSGANTFGGAFTLNSGALGLGSDSVGAPITSGPVGTGTFNINSVGSNGAVIRAVGGSRIVNNPVTVNGDFIINGTNALTLGGAMNLGATDRTIAVSSTQPATFSGGLTGAAGLTKQGAGTLILATGSTNSYAGITNVNRGTLQVNGLIDGSGTQVNVNNGGILAGTGTINRNVTVASGANLRPGTSPGTLTVGGAVTMQAGSGHMFQYVTPISPAAFDSGGSATAGTGNNLLTVNGTLDTQAGAILRIEGNFADFTLNLNYSFLVATGTTVNAFNFDNNANPTQFDTSAFVGYNPASFLQWRSVGTSVFLNMTPVPEPIHILLMCGGAAVGVQWFRRRKGKK